MEEEKLIRAEYSKGKVYESQFFLHTHDEYEIYMFVAGDADYIIEGKMYTLEPYDMIIIRKNEMHRVLHKSYNGDYKRFVMMINPAFFEKNNCVEYERQFLNVKTKKGHKIGADVVKSSGLYDSFVRMRKYSDNFKNTTTPVFYASVIEFLYHINCIENFTKDDASNKQMRDIINYINEHYTENITIDTLSSMFFISKYHLCRTFKKITGHTVHKFIVYKRIAKVKELVAKGMNISDAAAMAGFENYSSFYREYINETGVSPKVDMKNSTK